MLLYLNFLIVSCTYSQSLLRIMDRNELQGIWKGVEFIKNPSLDVTEDYRLFKGDKILHFDVNSNFISESYFGFQQVSSNIEPVADNFSYKDLKKRGNQFVY